MGSDKKVASKVQQSQHKYTEFMATVHEEGVICRFDQRTKKNYEWVMDENGVNLTMGLRQCNLWKKSCYSTFVNTPC